MKRATIRGQVPNDVEVELAGHRIVVARQSRLLDVCDAVPELPFVFGCREGGCGTCLVAVRPGSEVNEVVELESILLQAVAPDLPDARLGCQLRILGPSVIEPWPDDFRP